MSGSRDKPCALITGASSGIGAEYAGQLARRGHDLILVARRRERLEELGARLQSKAGAECEVIAVDLTDSAALATIEARVARHDRLAVLVNNAGFGGYRPFVELEPSVADDLIAIHIRAVTRLTRAALPGMLRRGSGTIINVASLLALSGTIPPDPLPYRAVYAGAKAFLVTFSQALAGELRGTKIRIQVLLPGLVDTEYHAAVGRDPSKMPPMMKPADLVAASLAALDNGEITCIPALDEPALLERLAETQRAMLGSARKTTTAARYNPG
jgi:short-subunit dehydrogenase